MKECKIVKSKNCRPHGLKFLVSINVCISIYPPKEVVDKGRRMLKWCKGWWSLCCVGSKCKRGHKHYSFSTWYDRHGWFWWTNVNKQPYFPIAAITPWMTTLYFWTAFFFLSHNFLYVLFLHFHLLQHLQHLTSIYLFMLDVNLDTFSEYLPFPT